MHALPIGGLGVLVLGSAVYILQNVPFSENMYLQNLCVIYVPFPFDLRANQ